MNAIALETGGFGKASGALSPRRNRGGLIVQDRLLTASSAERAIELSRARCPDLIVLDATGDECGCFAACRALRAFLPVPILYIADAGNLENRLDAFDAGANDLILKPITPSVLIRKIVLAVRQYRAHATLEQEKTVLERMAMGFPASASQTGVLLEFMRRSVALADYEALGENLVTTVLQALNAGRGTGQESVELF